MQTRDELQKSIENILEIKNRTNFDRNMMCGFSCFQITQLTSRYLESFIQRLTNFKLIMTDINNVNEEKSDLLNRKGVPQVFIGIRNFYSLSAISHFIEIVLSSFCYHIAAILLTM